MSTTESNAMTVVIAVTSFDGDTVSSTGAEHQHPLPVRSDLLPRSHSESVHQGVHLRGCPLLKIGAKWFDEAVRAVTHQKGVPYVYLA